MSLTRPIRPYHFQTDLIWWDGPFKHFRDLQKEQRQGKIYLLQSSNKPTVRHDTLYGYKKLGRYL